MKKILWMFILILALAALAACGNEDTSNGENSDDNSEEPKLLEVEFEVPETADVHETVELKAIVTYGDEKVTDADEVKMEYWEQGNEDDSTTVETTNNEDGTYTAEVTFDHDGIFEMYAHTTARDLHTMPKKSITVGDDESADQEDENHEDEAEAHEHAGHAEGFGMHFMEPEAVKAEQTTDLTVHLKMDGEPFENANVRYEIWHENNAEKHEWADAEPTKSGEFSTEYTFKETGKYTVIIHVTNDEGLHEHQEKEIEVAN